MTILDDFVAAIQKLQADNQPLRDEVTLLTAENINLSGQVDTLQQSLASAVNTRDSLQYQVNAYQLRVSELTDSNNDLTNQLGASNSVISALNVDIANAGSVLAGVRNELASMTAARDAAQTQVNTMQQTLTTRTSERDAAQAALNAAQAQLATTQALVVTRTTERDSARSSLASMTASRDAVTATLATRTTERDAARTALSTAQAQLAAANAEIARLRSLGVKINFGFSNASALEDNSLKRIYVVNGDGNPLPPAPTSGRLQVMTYKDAPGVANLEARISASRDGERIGTYHECEDDIEKWMYGYTKPDGTVVAPHVEGLDPAKYRSRMIGVCDAIVRLGKVGKVRPVSIIMGFSIEPQAPLRRRNIILNEVWTPDVIAALKRSGGILGVDVYGGPQTMVNGPTRPPNELYEPIIALAKQHGLDWGVYEAGAKINHNESRVAVLDKFAAWWTQVFDYLGTCEKPPIDFVFWNRAAINPDEMDTVTYAIDQQPKILEAVRQAVIKWGTTNLP